MSMSAAEDGIRELLRQRHRLQPGQDDSFTIRNLTEVLQAQEASSRVLTWLLAAVASVSLLVGGIGIMNIMLVSVTERTREIGLRMAVGRAGRGHPAQFLVEATTLALIGGPVGVGLGHGAAWAVAQLAAGRRSCRPSRSCWRWASPRHRHLLRLVPGPQGVAPPPIEALRTNSPDGSARSVSRWERAAEPAAARAAGARRGQAPERQHGVSFRRWRTSSRSRRRIATSWRAAFGTQSRSHSGSGARRFRRGGTIRARMATTQTAASSAPRRPAGGRASPWSSSPPAARRARRTPSGSPRTRRRRWPACRCRAR
jgi:hypothetical protein